MFAFRHGRKCSERPRWGAELPPRAGLNERLLTACASLLADRTTVQPSSREVWSQRAECAPLAKGGQNAIDKRERVRSARQPDPRLADSLHGSSCAAACIANGRRTRSNVRSIRQTGAQAVPLRSQVRRPNFAGGLPSARARHEIFSGVSGRCSAVPPIVSVGVELHAPRPRICSSYDGGVGARHGACAGQCPTCSKIRFIEVEIATPAMGCDERSRVLVTSTLPHA